MIKYPINKEQADTIPFQVNGVITHGGKKLIHYLYATQKIMYTQKNC